MAKKVAKTECDGKWSVARKRSFIISALRRASSRWSPKHTVIKEARVARNSYMCSQCLQIVGHKSIKCDHIEPVVPITGFTNYDDFIKRLFVEKHALAALCKTCHDKKSKDENQRRKQHKSDNMQFATEPKPDNTRWIHNKP